MVMDVRVIPSAVTMVNRAHGSKRKLLLSAAIAKRDRSIEQPRLHCPEQIEVPLEMP